MKTDHGKRSTYTTHYCRCKACTKANSVYQHQAYLRRRAARKRVK